MAYQYVAYDDYHKSCMGLIITRENNYLNWRALYDSDQHFNTQINYTSNS